MIVMPRQPLALAVLLALPALAHAQQPAAADEARTLDTVQVTGTRIRKAELENHVPVQVLTREDIARTGQTSIGDIVQNLTGSASSFNGKRNASGNDGFPSDGSGVGAGATTVDLRGLGAKRVLVLVDGMRWVNESSASGVGAAVDLNTIPLAIVERIEVLEDGASSLYGSDAIAGVVNIITRRSFDGAQISVNYGQYAPGDGETAGLDLVWGGEAGRAAWFLGGSVFDQKAVSSSDRARTREPVFGTGNALGSSRVPGGRFRFTDPSGNAYDLTTNAGLTNPAYTPGLPDCDSGTPRTDGFHCFGADDAFNYAPYNLVLSPSRRAGVFGQVRVDVSDNLRWYARALANRRESRNRAAPEPIDLGPGAGSVYTAEVVIPGSNPYNPFGFTLDSSNIQTIRRRPTEGGPRLFDQQVDTLYAGTGLEGTFGTDARWAWDVNLGWARNRAEQENRGSYNSLRIAQALDPAVCATVSGCVPLDIFGFDTITPEMLGWISPVFRDRSEQTLTQATANLTGDLFRLPAGPVGFATGLEYRKYQGEYHPDPATVRGEYNGVPSLPTAGEYDVSEVFVEFSIPVFRDSAFGKAFDISLAGRYSDYSTFGGEFTPKIGFRWQLADEFLLRSTYAEGFRAPSIGELYGAASRFDANLVDPCLTQRGTPATGNAANCAALGVTPNTPQFDPQIGVETGGNRALLPETSRSFSAGAVWTPSLLEDTALSRRVDLEVTFYRHQIDGAIQAIDPQSQLDLCVATLDPAYCNGIVRNGATSQIESFANYLGNLASIRTSGWDFDVTWALPDTAAGRFTLTWMNSWVKDYHAQSVDGTVQPLRPGWVVSDPVTRAIPEWASTAVLAWENGPWSASWTARHIDAMVESCGDAADFPICRNDPATGLNRLGATTFHDLQLGYSMDVLKGLQLQVGGRNVFGKDPPVCLSCNLNSFDGSTYDLPGGGYWYVRADLRF